ncbi:MAG: alpha/beta hydrolase fold domain-containing protein [Phormidesmis sp.]
MHHKFANNTSIVFWIRILLVGWAASAGLGSCSGADSFEEASGDELSDDISALTDTSNRFEQFDSNGDGSLTPDEVENRRIFSQLDTNADGQITRREARAYLEQRRNGERELEESEPVTIGRGGNRFEQFDSNGDGSLTPDELDNQRMFNRLDTNADGQITRREARAYLEQRRQDGGNLQNGNTQSDNTQSGNPQTGGGARNRFAQMDSNGDGKLTADELGNQRIFERLDTNADGQITRQEARAYLNNRQRNSNAPVDASASKADTAVNDTALLVSGAPAFDVAYSSAAGSNPKSTSLDIYPAPGSSSAPVVMYVHGGGWKNGDKGNVSGKPDYFNQNGYLFVSLNYRLIPDAEYPENVQDVADGIAWVHNNIQQYGGDPEKLFLVGHSSGAHLAGLVAADADYLTAAGESLGVLDGVVLLDSGAYDIPLNLQNSGPNSEALYVEAFGNNPAIWAEASPINQVSSGNQTPPFLLVHADRKSNKEDQAYEFSEALESAGVAVEIVAAPNETHQTLNRTLGEPSNVATDAIIDFFSGL